MQNENTFNNYINLTNLTNCLHIFDDFYNKLKTRKQEIENQNPNTKFI